VTPDAGEDPSQSVQSKNMQGPILSISGHRRATCSVSLTPS
jgi:hypothetical protein